MRASTQASTTPSAQNAAIARKPMLKLPARSLMTPNDIANTSGGFLMRSDTYPPRALEGPVMRSAVPEGWQAMVSG